MVKAKRYSVQVKVPLLNVWLTIANMVTKTQADVYEKTSIWETKVVEISE